MAIDIQYKILEVNWYGKDQLEQAMNQLSKDWELYQITEKRIYFQKIVEKEQETSRTPVYTVEDEDGIVIGVFSKREYADNFLAVLSDGYYYITTEYLDQPRGFKSFNPTQT